MLRLCHSLRFGARRWPLRRAAREQSNGPEHHRRKHRSEARRLGTWASGTVLRSLSRLGTIVVGCVLFRMRRLGTIAAITELGLQCVNLMTQSPYYHLFEQIKIIMEAEIIQHLLAVERAAAASRQRCALQMRFSTAPKRYEATASTAHALLVKMLVEVCFAPARLEAY